MVWNWMIALYLFLAGMGAGAFVLSGIAGMAKKPCPKIKTIGFIAGPVCVAVGTLLLVVDAHAGLMNPLRFFYLVSNLGSVMAWGVIILTLFIVLAAIDAIIMIVKKSTPRALDIIGMILAVCVAAYTGVLLGDASVAFPLWHPIILPILFLVSAASTGFALVLVIAHGKAHDEIANIGFTVRSGMVLPVLEALLVIALLGTVAITGGSAAAAANASVANLLTGGYALAFWVLFVIVGLAFPFVQALHKSMQERKSLMQQPGLTIAGEVGVLIGGFMLRYLIVMAAIPVALG